MTAKTKNPRVAAKVSEKIIIPIKLMKSSKFQPCKHSALLKFLHID